MGAGVHRLPLVEVPQASEDSLDRLVAELLPAAGQTMIAAGSHVGYVSALFPLSREEARAGLLTQLLAVAGFSGKDEVAVFLRRLMVRWLRSELSGNELYKMAGSRASLAADADAILEVSRAVGADHFEAFAGTYQCLSWTVDVLAAAVANREIFTGHQIEVLDTAVAFWFTVLAFDADVVRD